MLHFFTAQSPVEEQESSNYSFDASDVSVWVNFKLRSVVLNIVDMVTHIRIVSMVTMKTLLELLCGSVSS